VTRASGSTSADSEMSVSATTCVTRAAGVGCSSVSVMNCPTRGTGVVSVATNATTRATLAPVVMLCVTL
jgi:hypothetical protein